MENQDRRRPSFPASHGGVNLASLFDENGKGPDNYFISFPPGFRFKPTDQELIREYLIKKIKRQRLPPNRIHLEDIYRDSPQHLSERYPLLEGKEEAWYFFTSRDKKYPRGKRPNRSIGTLGYWKPTGALIKIKDEKSNKIIGSRGTLEFYEGKQRSHGTKSKWRMHEYELPEARQGTKTGNSMMLDEVVLVKIYINTRDVGKEEPTSELALVEANDPSSSSSPQSSVHQIQLPLLPPPPPLAPPLQTLGFGGQGLPFDFQWPQNRDHLQNDMDWMDEESEILSNSFNKLLD